MDLIPALFTDHLILRKIEHTDLTFIHSHFSNETVCKYMVDNEPVKTIEEAKDIIKWSHGDATNPTNNRWLITLKDTQEPIGTIGFHKWDKRNNITDIGYDLTPEAWQKGYMTEAITAVLPFLFEELKVNKVQAIVHVDNQASQLLLKKVGFEKEGLIRAMYLYRGVYHDHLLFGVLRGEYL